MFVKNSVFALVLAAAASTCYGLTMGYSQQFTLPYVARPGCTLSYVVRRGDTCNSISQAMGVSMYQLISANEGLINPQCTNLFCGELLCLVIDGDWCRPVDTVGYGDTCESIADRNGITVDTLHQDNPNISPDCTSLEVGEVLCVAPAYNPESQFGVNNGYSRGGCGAV